MAARAPTAATAASVAVVALDQEQQQQQLLRQQLAVAGEPDPPELYARLGIAPFINCCATTTINGGSRTAPQVIEAMHQVLQSLFHGCQPIFPRPHSPISQRKLPTGTSEG